MALFRLLNIKKENPANAFQVLHKASKTGQRRFFSLGLYFPREKGQIS